MIDLIQKSKEILQKIILPQNKSNSVLTNTGKEFQVIQREKNLDEILSDAADQMESQDYSGGGSGHQDIFKCIIALKNSEGKEIYSISPGETVHLYAQLDYMLNNPSEVPVIFFGKLTIPTGETILFIPTPAHNPNLPIYADPPLGNLRKWACTFKWDDQLICHHISSGGVIGGQIFPIEFTSAFPAGTYTVSFEVWYNDNSGLAAYVSSDEVTFLMQQQPYQSVKISQYDRVKFHDDQRIEYIDFDRISQQTMGALVLLSSAVFDGKDAVLDGMKLAVYQDDNGKYVGIGPGKGTVYGSVDGFNGNHIIVLQDRCLPVGYFTAHLPPEDERWDLICLGLETIDEGIEEGSPGDDRVFLESGQFNPDGSPVLKTKTVPTRRKLRAVPEWINGADETTARAMKAPFGKLKLGYAVTKKSTGEYYVVNESYPAMTVLKHRTSQSLDHANGSVRKQHIDSNIIGADFTPGVDLSLKKIADEVRYARGNKSSVNERLEYVITPDGLIVEDTFRPVIDERLTYMLSGLIDQKGNLKPGALADLGVVATVAGTMGAVPSESDIQVPNRWSQDKCYWFAGAANFGFSPGSGGQPAVHIGVKCEMVGLIARVYTEVQYAGSTSLITLHGTANFICIGFKTSSEY